ncbi:MAG: DNA-3-methyladenine glycosylase [Verrucomicrobiota bacterium]|nr:DNA-3-methyladenine glycosylase [Verrucomicrobiota bacterium]MEC9228201.1 DNA-3-methyladenine glycosylase [Verrucomicrobiota bacterium]
MSRVISSVFFDRATVTVAKELLGKTICRRLKSGKILRARIIETEAYDGFEDQASHAYKGATTRNVVMFGPPGRSYVTLCYGVHYLFNVTTREKGYPAAVLIRGLHGVDGPGRTTKFLQIDRSQNDQLLNRVNGLWLEDDGIGPKQGAVKALPRIGVEYAGVKWSKKPWRFNWSVN